jgi:fructokinase
MQPAADVMADALSKVAMKAPVVPVVANVGAAPLTDPAAIRAGLPQQPAVVVTDGGAQLAWCFGAHSGSMPAFAVELVDSTGAGDAFLAGLLHRLCAEPDLLRADGDDAIADRLTTAIRFASACGALVCQGAGGIDPQPAAEQVEAFVRSTAADPPAAVRR